MAGEYNINLSDGSLLTTIYRREVNGGVSTPWKIIATDDVLNTFTIQGDVTFGGVRFQPGFVFTVSGSSGGINNGTYTVLSVANPVDINLGTLTVITIDTTVILPQKNDILPITSPFGLISYSTPADTTLILPGFESLNYGENIIEGILHIVENFSNVGAGVINAPANPLVGQQFYNSSEDTFYHLDSTLTWSNNLVLGNLVATDGQFSGRVGINNPIPTGTVYLEVTGDIQANSQFRGSDQSAGAPTYTFKNDLTSGSYRSATSVGVAFGGTSIAEFKSTGIVLNVGEILGLPATPSATGAASKEYVTSQVGTVSGNLTTHISDTTIHFTEGSIDHLNITNIGVNSHSAIDTHIGDATIHFTQGSISITSSQISDFATGIDTHLGLSSIDLFGDVDTTTLTPTTGDVLSWDGTNWIPGTVTPGSIPKYEEQVAGASQTVFNTTISTVSNTSGGNAKLQVFVNGIYNMEGATKAYTVTGPNQITFNAAVPASADVIMYAF